MRGIGSPASTRSGSASLRCRFRCERRGFDRSRLCAGAVCVLVKSAERSPDDRPQRRSEGDRAAIGDRPFLWLGKATRRAMRGWRPRRDLRRDPHHRTTRWHSLPRDRRGAWVGVAPGIRRVATSAPALCARPRHDPGAVPRDPAMRGVSILPCSMREASGVSPPGRGGRRAACRLRRQLLAVPHSPRIQLGPLPNRYGRTRHLRAKRNFVTDARVSQDGAT